MQYVFEKLPKTMTASSRVALRRIDGTAAAGLVRAVVEPLVDLVREQPEVVPAREVEQAVLLLVGRDPAERVRRRRVEQQPRARRDGGLERVEVDDVALADENVGDLDRRRVRQPDDGGAVRPGRRQAERLVARIEQRADAQVQRLHAGGGDDDLRAGIELDVVQAAVLTGERLAQRRQARVLRVVREPVRERPRCRILDESGRGQGRLAEVEPQHVRHGHGHLGDLPDP